MPPKVFCFNNIALQSSVLYCVTNIFEVHLLMWQKKKIQEEEVVACKIDLAFNPQGATVFRVSIPVLTTLQIARQTFSHLSRWVIFIADAYAAPQLQQRYEH